ncbi:MFS transporter [Solitalea koreensis]|uniref:Predicted arabinose efflux permease, MFS family n=1 Tax=Solitalea koreensis TaxID=543615 RepID=A0A521BGM0_9SPHI|nr:MFS transporter [Solitalea koreensis]SMO46254.1 Predicted arabinose efflux permease, MFS family [Solitalea koreensis]
MKKENTLLIIFAFINFTHLLDFMIMMPLGDLFMRIFKITPQQFSFLVSSYTISAGVAGFFSAFYVDKFDRKTALLLNYAGFCLGTLSCAFAKSFEVLLIARSITGIFGGVIGAMIIAIISDVFPYERRGFAMGVLTAGFSVAAVIGVPAGLYLALKMDWHFPFILIGSMGIILGLVLWKVMPSMNEHVVQSDKKFDNPILLMRDIVTDRNQRLALSLNFTIVVGQFLLIPFISQYLIRNVGLNQEQIPMVYLVGGLFTIFTMPLIGKLTDRLGAMKIFITVLLISIIPFVLITNLPKVSIVTALMVTTAFFIFGSGRMVPAQTITTAVVPPQKRGSFMSIRASVQQLGTAMASLLSGFMVTSTTTGPLLGYNYVGFLAVGVSCITLFIAPKLKVVKQIV